MKLIIYPPLFFTAHYFIVRESSTISNTIFIKVVTRMFTNGMTVIRITKKNVDISLLSLSISSPVKLATSSALMEFTINIMKANTQFIIDTINIVK